MKDLLEARLTKRRPVADIEEGHISTASCVLANVSMGLGGRTLQYDPATGVVKGDAEERDCSHVPTASPGFIRTRSASEPRYCAAANRKTSGAFQLMAISLEA